MAENRCSCGQGSASASSAKANVCIDTMRVLDSCRDRDCYEDVRAYLTPVGQGIITSTSTVRTTEARILGTSIGVDALPFNRGFYQVTVRFYIRLKSEACVQAGITREFTALAVVEKSVVLYGGEGSTSVFRSTSGEGFCKVNLALDSCEHAPTSVVEVVSPVVLSSRVGCRESRSCCVSASQCGCSSCGEGNATIPDEILAFFPDGLEPLGEDGTPGLYVSLGIFSVIRLERAAQYTVSATPASVPDKECHPACRDEDPCCLFRAMEFPVTEFGVDMNERKQHGH